MNYLKTIVASLLLTLLLAGCSTSRCSRGFSELQKSSEHQSIAQNYS